MPDWAVVYERLRASCAARGVRVLEREMEPETTGVFDGPTIVTNTAYDLETRCHNVAHSLGHIAQWSLDHDAHHRLYERLYAAKAASANDPEPLRLALESFRAYEEEASQYAAWLLGEAGCDDALPAFTNFARADIEAIVGFHRDGIAPVWREFFAGWNDDVTLGRRQSQPFEPKPIPPFTPRLITPQEVIQEVDGLA
jgi:hypothetical protein